MKPWRTALLLSLILLPITLYAAVGGWALWHTGHLRWLWWVLPVTWLVAYLLARHWRSEMLPRPPARIDKPSHWSAQDEEAARLIVAWQEAVDTLDPAQLAEPRFYLDSALEMGLEIAKAYHPKAADPVESLTVPEILTAAQLAIEDLEKWLRQYVPGGHLLSVRQWRQLGRAPKWIRRAGDTGWAASMLLKLGNIGRYAVWKVAMEPVTRKMHSDVRAVFYVYFVRQVGIYLIEMNSGRLRGGVQPYREMLDQLQQDPAARVDAVTGRRNTPREEVESGVEVVIALIGQTNAGKSSLINAMLGQHSAETDVLPKSDEVKRYRLQLPDVSDRLVLLDTPGYGMAGASRRQTKQTLAALKQADIVLLVMNASNPARDADQTALLQFEQQLSGQSQMKPPPVVGVLTHIDCLSPILEWEPPYNWQTPSHRKEESIRGAVDYALEKFGQHLVGVVPVCSDVPTGRIFGVEEWLLPVIAASLSEARGCAVLRALHHELDRQKVRDLFRQVLTGGKALLDLYQSATGPTGRNPNSV